MSFSISSLKDDVKYMKKQVTMISDKVEEQILNSSTIEYQFPEEENKANNQANNENVNRKPSQKNEETNNSSTGKPNNKGDNPTTAQKNNTEQKQTSEQKASETSEKKK